MADLTPRADVAKCSGVAIGRICPLRENCLRWLRPAAKPAQVWLYAQPQRTVATYDSAEPEPVSPPYKLTPDTITLRRRPWWEVFGLERSYAASLRRRGLSPRNELLDMDAHNARRSGVHPDEVSAALAEARAEFEKPRDGGEEINHA